MIASAQAIGNLYDPLNVMMEIIERTSTKLKSLYLENVNKDFIRTASTKDFWTRLNRITIRNEFDSLDATLFSLPPNLEFFSFSGELVATPAPYTAHLDSALRTRIDFLELKWLRVSLISMGTLARLNLPKLHTMAIDCVQGNYPMPAPPPGTLLLPALKVLQIATVNPTIACINAPALDTLCLSVPALKQADADKVLKEVFSGHDGMMKPKHLTLRGPVHDKHLVVALRILGDRLVSLELDYQLPYSKTFWQEMTPSSIPRRGFRSTAASIMATVTGGAINGGGSGGGNTGVGGGVGVGSVGSVTSLSTTAGRKYKQPLLPKLRCLVVDVHKSPMAQGEGREMRALLQKLVEGRRGNDMYENLLRLGCKWREGTAVEEIVDPPMCLSCADRGGGTARS